MKNIAPACLVLWLASACQKTYEPAPLQNNTLLSAVQVYGENVSGDTTNYRLKYDQEQRYTGCSVYMNASLVSYLDNTISYGGSWQVLRFTVQGTSYEETDSSRMNTQFNPLERTRVFSASQGGSVWDRFTGRQTLSYTYDNAGHYRSFRIRGWLDRLTESSSLGKFHIVNTDSSDGQLQFENNLLQQTKVDATAWSWDSTAQGETVTQTWSTHTKNFFYPDKTAAPPVHRNAYAHQVFYPLEPYFFNGALRMANLPDRVETIIERKDAQGRVLQTEVRTEIFRYEFYPSGFIRTIRVSSGGNTVVYRYTYAID